LADRTTFVTNPQAQEIGAALRKAKRLEDEVVVVASWRKFQGVVTHLNERWVFVDTWGYEDEGREYRIPLKEVIAVEEGGEKEAC
jgi:hypothetical protein